MQNTGTNKLQPALAESNGDLFLDATSLIETLHNMPMGVVTFGKDLRLIFCNQRYIEMYNLSRDSIKLGCTIQEIIEERQRTGLFQGNAKAYCADIVETMKRGNAESTYLETSDGRTVHILSQPMPSGGWVAIHEDVTESKKAEQQIAFLAHHDALTHLPNRALFKKQLEKALCKEECEQRLAVLFIDLDNFKNINDTLGHQVGDALLQAVAKRLKACLRENDLIARLGGDEFVVVQSEVNSSEDAAALATRIRTALKAPLKLDGHEIVVDTSIGVAMAPDDGHTHDILLKCADMALYGAKSGGRATYRFFEQEMDQRMIERRTIELELRHALVNREFELHFQPLLNLKRNTVSCCEALIRWNHPTRGLMAPNSFITIAEETGLITRIGEWVIRTACDQAANWPDDINIAINISPVQFRCQNLIQVVANSLATSGLAPHRLEIEITEALLLDDTDQVLSVLKGLKRLGVRISMDDFGTGYSSLSYLQKFPFNKIKIDKAFVQNLSDEAGSDAIIRAIVGIAESLNMSTTAEGVETLRQKEIVTALGCVEMQGYLFARPQTADNIYQFFGVISPTATHIQLPKEQQS